MKKFSTKVITLMVITFITLLAVGCSAPSQSKTEITPYTISAKHIFIVKVGGDTPHFITVVPPVRDKIIGSTLTQDKDKAHIIYGISHLNNTYIYDSVIDIKSGTVSHTATLITAVSKFFSGDVSFHKTNSGVWSYIDTGKGAFVIFIDKDGKITFDSRKQLKNNIAWLSCVGSGILTTPSGDGWIALSGDTPKIVKVAGDKVLLEKNLDVTDMKVVGGGILVATKDGKILFLDDQGGTVWSSDRLPQGAVLLKSSGGCMVSSCTASTDNGFVAFYIVDGKLHALQVDSKGNTISDKELLAIPHIDGTHPYISVSKQNSTISWKLYLGMGSAIAEGTLNVNGGTAPEHSELVAAAYTNTAHEMFAYLPDKGIMKLGKGYISYDPYSSSANLLAIFYEDTSFTKTSLMLINTETGEKSDQKLLDIGEGVFDIKVPHTISQPFFASIGSSDIVLYSQAFKPLWKASQAFPYRLANERDDGIKSIIDTSHAIVIWKTESGYKLADVNTSGKIVKDVDFDNIHMIKATDKYFFIVNEDQKIHYTVLNKENLSPVWDEGKLTDLKKLVIYEGAGTPYTTIENTFIFMYIGKDSKVHIAAVRDGQILWNKVVYDNTDIEGIVYPDDGNITLNYTIFTPYGDILKSGTIDILPDGSLRE